MQRSEFLKIGANPGFFVIAGPDPQSHRTHANDWYEPRKLYENHPCVRRRISRTITSNYPLCASEWRFHAQTEQKPNDSGSLASASPIRPGISEFKRFIWLENG